MSHLWLLCALGSAVIWGFGYALSERVMQGGVTPAFLGVWIGGTYALGSVLLMVASGQVQTQLATLGSNSGLIWNLVASSVAYAIGSWLIYVAISLKNATLPSLIEVTYPVWTALFAYLLFREVQVNAWTAVGSALILGGVIIIFLKS